MSAESPIIDDNLRKYIDLVGYNESELLKRNREETQKLGSLSIMQVGAAQGAFLSILCKVSNFKSCLEVGVFTGYSSLCIGSSISDESKPSFELYRDSLTQRLDSIPFSEVL